MMASHTMTIARASFIATMMKPDPTSLSRSETTGFLDTLEKMLNYCSPTNIQLCKEWLVQNVLSSTGRVSLFGKYLVARSESLGKSDAVDDGVSEDQDPPPQRKQLHLLYLLHDFFHHAEFHTTSTRATILSSNFQSCLESIVKAVSGRQPDDASLKQHRLQDLLQLWQEGSLVDSRCLEELYEIARKGNLKDQSAAIKPRVTNDVSEENRNAPYTMPSSHGDGSTPFYDLPASNMMPHIMPDSTKPINSKLLRPLTLSPGPADVTLTTAVKAFLKDVDSIDQPVPEKQAQLQIDIDELGQVILRDHTDANGIGTEGYYGWSQEFCQMIKRGESIGMLRATSSQDQMDDQGLQSYRTRRRSPSPDGGFRSRSRSPLRSRSGPRRQTRRSRSTSRSYSPPTAFERPSEASRARSPPYDPRRVSQSRSHGPDHPQAYQCAPPPAATFPQPVAGGFPFPPRPANYSGMWPPPPPQAPPSGPRSSSPPQGVPFIHGFNGQSNMTRLPDLGSWNQQQWSQPGTQDFAPGYGLPYTVNGQRTNKYHNP